MFEQTFKNFKINFNAVNERSTFSSGDLVTGHISFELTKETKIASISMELKGRAHVHWSTQGSGGRKRRRGRRHFSATLDFFNFRSAILHEHRVCGEATKFRPGTHLYPFTCQLPQGNFPSTFHGVHGETVYNITVCISRPWHLSKDFVTELNFVNHIDTNQPELQAPLSGSNQMTLCCLWCASPPITMTVSVEKKAFVPGETVRIICEFSNRSSRTVTPKVRLVQKQIYYTHNKVNKNMIVKSLASMTGQPIGDHTSEVHTEMMITIPSSAPHTISNCSILVVEYLVERHTSEHIKPLSSLSHWAMSLYLMLSGDRITGQITLDLSGDCKIDAICVKLKGKAEVKWTENYGKTAVTYHNKEKYFSIKQFVIPEGQGNNIGKGCHVYPFTFQIPAQELPSSFKGSCGKIRYSLEANLSRPMRLDCKAKEQFTLLHRGNSDPSLMTPQHSVIDKKMRLFTSGTVGMDANIAHTGFRQGEGIKVVASIHNKSSRDIKPKYCLYEKISYFAKGKRRVQTKDILKEVGDAIPPSAGQTVTRTITIPPTTCASILNCNIIKAEYRLRVYLDVKYASDPEIKFPIIILPALQGPVEEDQPPAYPAYGYEGFANSDMLGGTSFLQNPTALVPSAPPPTYSTYGLYPSLTGYDEK
ncbi:uncharacterized protein LOC118313506 isoform X2 [Scophthalmus maximus]|uniref:uncharacterized protein LOC118313506 isoform X2 n=1 Tax=Scophthalmus maximus TaxID=52904 RepID=UPI001FA8EAB0|nr:uncharacterized protein LOC118313506 isoform X2 [Scophthalmus maximus]